MENKIAFELIQEKVIDLVKQHNGLLSITKIANALGESVNIIYPIIKLLESEPGLLKTQKIGKERIVFLSFKTDRTRENLMRELSIDKLELRILEEVEEDESPQEAAKKLDALFTQVAARMETSIPVKFGVEEFKEAKRKFKKKLVTA